MVALLKLFWKYIYIMDCVSSGKPRELIKEKLFLNEFNVWIRDCHTQSIVSDILSWPSLDDYNMPLFYGTTFEK